MTIFIYYEEVVPYVVLDREKRRASRRKYNASEKGKENNRNYARKWRAAHPKRNAEITKKWRAANPEKDRENSRKWKIANREKYLKIKRISYRKMSQDPAWRDKINKRNRKLYHENIEKERARGKKYREKNPEKIHIKQKKYRESERGKEYLKAWRASNPDSIDGYAKKYRKKNPRASTEIMQKYRRSHRECEWSSCDRASAEVNHILPQFKYPEYVDGDYHGRAGNNFICYCLFHHHAYHYAYAANRNDKTHKKLLAFMWNKVKLWAEENKIPINALETELNIMLAKFSK